VLAKLPRRMGEDAIAPSEAPGNVEAEVSAVDSPPPLGEGRVGAETPEDQAASIVAQQEKGSEIRAAAAEAPRPWPSIARSTARGSRGARCLRQRDGCRGASTLTQLTEERTRAQSEVPSTDRNGTGQQREVARPSSH